MPLLLLWVFLIARPHIAWAQTTSSSMRGPHHPRGTTRVHHEHYTPQRTDQEPAKLTQDTKLLRDHEHLQEDLESWRAKDDINKMTGEEMEFYYFRLHDFDNNTKLDGLEILRAIQHTVHQGEDGKKENDETSTTAPQHETFDFNYYIELIDKVLEEDDLDGDGYLSYIEYVLGRQKDDHEFQQHQHASISAS